MRRIVSAITPAIALVVSAVPLASQAAVPFGVGSRAHQHADHRAHHHHGRHHHARHHRRGATALDTASTALGTSYVHVSWNWIKAAAGYRIQISKNQDFGAVVVAKKKANSRHRPAGGREAAVVGKLRDATYYWVRVKAKGHHHTSWSPPVRVATRAHVPDKITDGRGGVGPQAGETTLRWKGDGGYTDFYRITTALTPFGTPKTPAVGHHSMTFRVSGKRHSLTLTPQQTAAAGAGMGSGRHLFFRILAIRKGEADSASRRYPFLLHTAIRGEHSTGNGTQMRYAAYSMRVATKDVPGHPWKKRQHLIARNIARVHPAVAALEELMPGMWDNRMGGVGLHKSLKQAGAGRYRLTRDTAYFPNAPQDTKILYDPTKVQLISKCPTDVPSCYIPLPDPDHQRVAAYAKFKDLALGQGVLLHQRPPEHRATTRPPTRSVGFRPRPSTPRSGASTPRTCRSSSPATPTARRPRRATTCRTRCGSTTGGTTRCRPRRWSTVSTTPWSTTSRRSGPRTTASAACTTRS